MDISQRIDAQARLIEARLERLLGDASGPAGGDASKPQRRLASAMRYAALSGGKRIRPVLVLECAGLFGIAPNACLNAAAALECVHCYSLVHDDLPSMDNDALRRGQPSVWKAYDEWTAILAGDGLLTFAFEILTQPATHPDAAVRLELISILTRASGVNGMAQGQALDLAASKMSGPAELSADDVKTLQALKTGALIETACVFGAVLGDADTNARAAVKRFGTALGLAFQIADDLLDLEGSAGQAGKATGKDAAAGKATLPALMGKEAARRELSAASDAALNALQSFGARADVLRRLTAFIGNRDH